MMIFPFVRHCQFLMQCEGPIERGGLGSAAQVLGKHFSIALSNELELIGLTPTQMAIRAGAYNEKFKGRNRTHIKVRVSAKIPNATHRQFIDATLLAKTKCMTQMDSRSKISIEAHLEPLGRS